MNENDLSSDNLICIITGAQPKAGTGHKMLFVHFVFSKSRFQGPANHCDKIVVTVTLLEVIDRLDFRRSLVSGQFGEERGLLSRTAAGNRA